MAVTGCAKSSVTTLGLGPCLLTCGIWRPIKLIAGSGIRLKDIDIKQKHGKDGSVTLDIKVVRTSAGKNKN